MTIRPGRPQGVAADDLDAIQLKGAWRIKSLGRPVHAAEGIWLPAARGAGAGAAHCLQREISFDIVVPADCQLRRPEWLKVHGNKRGRHGDCNLTPAVPSTSRRT